MFSPSFVLCGCETFGGIWARGMSLHPSSNLACVAILTLVVSGSCHEMFRVVCGAHPRKMPFWELGFSLARLFPGGRTHTLHPNVRKFMKSSILFVAFESDDLSDILDGSALCIRSAWQKAHGQNFKDMFAPARRARIASATDRWPCLTGPFWLDASAPVGSITHPAFVNGFLISGLLNGSPP